MFESISLDPLVAGAVALFGVVLGLLLGRFLLPGPREVKRLRGEIERLGREHADYQTRVAGHFEKTGELIGQMTESYKAVYDHLADGAQSLCAAAALPKPPFATPRLILDESMNVGDAATAAVPQAQTVRLEPTEPSSTTPTPQTNTHTLEAAGGTMELPVVNGPDSLSVGESKVDLPR